MEALRKAPVAVFGNFDKERFLQEIYPLRKPALLKGIPLGTCTSKWTVDYLSTTGGSQEVKVHVASVPQMDFINKNFIYRYFRWKIHDEFGTPTHPELLISNHGEKSSGDQSYVGKARKFANSLPINDPLQTVYQLMSGRMPAAATCCGDERWGDWRPHLAMVLSNLSHGLDLDRKTITTMGDTLATKGLLDASHFCYLMAQIGFGVYTRKATKLVLIGSNHSWSFLRFASNGAIQRTEAYEYAQALGNQVCFLPNFQVFKFIYACRLAEMGLAAQAFHYCEVIARTVLRNPVYYSPVFLSQLIQISSQLRFFDPQLKERSEQELHVEPDWIKHLQQTESQLKDGAFVCRSGRATPQPFCSSTPSSEYDQVSQSDGLTTGPQEEASGVDNPLMTSFVPDAGLPGMLGVQLMPPAPPHTVLDSRPMAAPPPQMMMMDGSIPMYSPTQASPGFPGQSPNSAFKQPYDPAKGPLSMGPLGPTSGPPAEALQTVLEQQLPENIECNSINQQTSPKRHSFGESGQQDFYDHMAKMAPGRRSRSTSQSSLHMGGWLSWLRPGRKNEAHLPDDKNKSIVWDEKKQRWVNLNEPEEESKPLPPPPSFPMTAPVPALSSTTSPALGGGPPPRNRFSMKAGTKARYVDVLNPSGSRPGGVLLPPVDLFAPLAPMPIPTNLFVPLPGEGSQPSEGSPAENSQPVEETNPEGTAQAQFADDTKLGNVRRDEDTKRLQCSMILKQLRLEPQHPSNFHSNVEGADGWASTCDG
ncbi:hypothetical protein scyTo_0004922 [Scyliorhinus torazame]|uniref:Sec16 Sec23-binding domain-containing protein n=1 Tax=Scyliorhinus torazame TaxID=75743 RepID=A0A401NZ63_SCYTO|nr:hypothetical protein [Scyliorhinus torazame]